MNAFPQSAACASRLHCRGCRENPAAFADDRQPFDCPHGVTLATLPPVSITPAVEAPPPIPCRSAADQKAALAICDDCPHQKLLEHDAPSCKLITAQSGCASCRTRFVLALDYGKCPEGKW